MSTILLIICIFSLSFQNVFKKQYNNKVQHGVFCFNAIASFFALLFFLIPVWIKGFQFDSKLIGYSVAYAISYILALVGIQLAILWGGFGMSSLIFSFSTVIPTVYALLFLNEKMTTVMGVGFVMLIISLILTNSDYSVSGKVSMKWVVTIIVAFFGNGMCSVIQNVQQVNFNGGYKNEYMVLSLIVVEVLLWGIVLVKERPHIKESFSKGVFPAAACGICNGATNILVMVLLGMMASSILFPAISAGGIILSFAFAIFVYKEKLARKQSIGVVFGIIAIVLLNL